MVDTSFVEWMLDSGYRELLLEYPVLLDQISNILVEFIDLIEECVQKLELHKEDIYRKFGINVDDTITDIKCDVSDRHFCGKCVVIVSFQSKKIVYKPRNMSVDFFWMKVANWISDIDNQIEVRAANVLVGNDYGFVEWIEADLNLCKEEIEKYIYRCGNLLGVVSLLGGSDFHYENVICSGATPILIDVDPYHVNLHSAAKRRHK